MLLKRNFIYCIILRAGRTDKTTRDLEHAELLLDARGRVGGLLHVKDVEAHGLRQGSGKGEDTEQDQQQAHGGSTHQTPMHQA